MRALPEITTENEAFWTGGKGGELCITFCNDCAAAIHPPQIICATCLSRNVGPRAVAGTGTVYSYTINHQPWLPDMPVPFAIAVVDVDGAPGVRVTAQVITDDPEAVRIGQRMRVRFQNVEDHVWLPEWEPLPNQTQQGEPRA